MRLLSIPLALIFASMAQGSVVFKSESGFPGATTVEECFMPTDAQHVGFATVTIPYLDIRGKTKIGQGKCYFTPELLAKNKPLPVYVAAHYPIDQETAARFCRQGFLAVTPCTDNHPREFVLGVSEYTDPPVLDRVELFLNGVMSKQITRFSEFVTRLVNRGYSHSIVDGGLELMS